jgi:hypothetical protein
MVGRWHEDDEAADRDERNLRRISRVVRRAASAGR